MRVCTIMQVCSQYSALVLHGSSFTDAFNTPYGERDKSVLIQGTGRIRLCNVQRIPENREMKVSPSHPYDELFHIKSIYREQHRQNRLMASNVPQNTRTFQHRRLKPNGAGASVQTMKLSRNIQRGKRNYRR